MNRALAKPQAPAPNYDWNKPVSRSGLEAFLPLVSNQVARALPKFLEGAQDRLLRCLLTETTKNPALLECTPVSLFGTVVQAGQLGLTIGGFLGEAYILPFRNGKLSTHYGFDVKDATLIMGYKGIVQLAHRSNKLKRLTPVAVRQGDRFHYRRGLEQDLIHEPLRNNTGPVTDYYVVISTINGGTDFETFTVEDALAFRDRYSTVRSAPQFVRDKSPWYDVREEKGQIVTGNGFDSMALKTLIRRLGKRMPLSVEWSVAMSLDEAGEEGGVEQNLGALIDIPSPIADEPDPPSVPATVAGGSKADELAKNLEAAKGKKGSKPPAGHPERDPFESGEVGGTTD